MIHKKLNKILGHATFTKEPTKEQLEAINKLAELAMEQSFNFCQGEDCVGHPKKFIENIKRKLCVECNFKRLHGISKYEHQLKKNEEYVQRRLEKNKRSLPVSNRQEPKTDGKRYETIKKTKRQSIQENKLKQAYKSFDEVNSNKWCQGCGQTENLSHSHILRQDWCKKNSREDLIYSPENITYHCLSVGKTGCHQKWESGIVSEMMELNDFYDNLLFIRGVSEEEFQKIILKISDEEMYVHLQETIGR